MAQCIRSFPRPRIPHGRGRQRFDNQRGKQGQGKRADPCAPVPFGYGLREECREQPRFFQGPCSIYHRRRLDGFARDHARSGSRHRNGLRPRPRERQGVHRKAGGPVHRIRGDRPRRREGAEERLRKRTQSHKPGQRGRRGDMRRLRRRTGYHCKVQIFKDFRQEGQTCG